MTDKDSGWDALFNPEDEFDSNLESAARPGRASSPILDGYLQLPGVRGAIQVTFDGVVLHQDVPGDVQYYAALSALIGSAARQVDRTLRLEGFEYAVVRLAADTHSTMIIRVGDTFVGLLLSGEIAPTHIVTRLRDMRSGGAG